MVSPAVRLKRWSPWYWLLLLLAAGLAASCAGGTPTPIPIRDPESLVDALRGAGAVVERVEQAGPILDLPQPQFYLLDGALVQLGAIGPALEAPRGLDRVAADNPAVRLWTGAGWYLAYAGRDGGVILLLSGLLGEPLQPARDGLEEPFPPVIPLAMRVFAESMGVSPGELDVVEYRPTAWPDACLGLYAGDDCLQVETPGWSLVLELEGRRYVVHSDESGGIVRWSEPPASTED